MYKKNHNQDLEYLCKLFLKWLRGNSADILQHEFPFQLVLHKFHWKAFVGGFAVILYNVASGVYGLHSSFSEISSKDSPQFLSKILSLSQAEESKNPPGK